MWIEVLAEVLAEVLVEATGDKLLSVHIERISTKIN